MKKNSGFSLVELVVVILIMAIIAVALAPQVMKWVRNSRNASDEQTKNELLRICELALTNEEAFNKVKDGGYIMTITKDDSGVHYAYKNHEGEDSTPDMTNEYWRHMLEVAGATDVATFEKSMTIKSEPDGEPIVIEIHVYENGNTTGTLTGIVNEELGMS